MAATWGNAAHIFGADAKLHPITGRYIEQGIGALPEGAQITQHLRDIEQEQGTAVAAKMRAQLIAEQDGATK